MHHVREVHGSDHNRSTRDRRIVFIECIGADAWPLLACPEFADDQPEGSSPWYHHASAVLDGSTSTLRGPRNEALQLSWPAADGRGTAMMGDGVSEAARFEAAPVPVRMPLPRASAEGLPGGGIYSLHTLLKGKSFGSSAKL